MHVFVTGGAGYIGSVVAEALLRRGDTVTVYDDLSTGHRDAVPPGAAFVAGTLLDRARLREALLQARPDAVVHMAAVCLVGESVSDPIKYYRVNVEGGLSLLEAMHDVGIGKLVFSSSCSVYGESSKQPIDEDDPTAPSNPYGESKLSFERSLPWYYRAYGIRSIALRYFNAAGASSVAGERHDPETHLIPIVLQVAAGVRPKLVIYGDDYPTRDGTCVRDYIHVLDLAEAHVLALSAVADGMPGAAYNLGCGGAGVSVRETVAAVESVTGRTVPIAIGRRRDGDPAVLVAAATKIHRDLGWRPRYPELTDIITSAWTFMQSGR